jgi:hypothetical protein
MTQARNNIVYQFKIVLREIEPMIWRVIQTPSNYSFWDLHVAIQDAMGWLDCHLHAFRVRMPHKKADMVIGIPDDDSYDLEILPGWELQIAEFFTEPGKTVIYDYDFGDSWSHEVILEAILLKEKAVKYPRCINGERACPPEDCGGVPGYYEHLKILSDSKRPEYREHVAWLKGHLKNYFPYEPDNFDPDNVKFWDPKKRWKMAFSNK